ncbi:MAG: response regulator transcription factor [Elusimicrobia bacterium]|nr:response regulator transcription factor [Elusimicrobiota bacterium]
MKGKKGVVLVVDDDPMIREMLEPALKQAGYETRMTSSADKAFAVLRSGPVDILILDIVLPGIDGIQMLGLLKKDAATAGLPVLMLTNQVSERSKVSGLKTGADDYVVKPFSIHELLARVEALLRRSQRSGRMDAVLEAGGIVMNIDARSVTANGKKVDLTVIEFDLLALLIRREGNVLSYQALSDAMSEGARIMTSESVYNHVKNIRAKLGGAGKRIETVHGIGYKFDRDAK